MKKLFFTFIVALIIVSTFQSVVASVGLGATPSKMELNLQGGQEKAFEVTVYNTGDSPIGVTLSAEGEIADFVDFQENYAVIAPEPLPHELPLKNGHVFTVKITPPANKEFKTYKGIISASGTPENYGKFAGTVSVATIVEAKVNSPFYLKSVLGVITIQQSVLLAAFIPLIAGGFMLVKRVGLKKKKKQ